MRVADRARSNAGLCGRAARLGLPGDRQGAAAAAAGRRAPHRAGQRQILYAQADRRPVQSARLVSRPASADAADRRPWRGHHRARLRLLPLADRHRARRVGLYRGAARGLFRPRNGRLQERRTQGLRLDDGHRQRDQRGRRARRADYFASLKPRPWIRVVETDTVPKTYVGPGNKRLRLPGGETEPIGNRIIEIPEDENVVLNRDPSSGFVAMVPKGSIAKGQAIVTTGADKTVPCAICHGQTLRGLGEVPPIAGRQANYVVRQLFSIQDGSRGGVSSALMQQVVERLTLDDMLAIAAYTASRQP